MALTTHRRRFGRYLPATLMIATIGLWSPVDAAPDRALLAAATEAEPAVIHTLRTLVEIESGSGDAEGLARLADLLDAELRDLGFTTRRETSRHDVNADTVVGVKTGTGEQRVLLMAHMDTVYLPGILETQPIRTEGNRLYGPGVVDAKGGIALILHALAILNDAGWTDYATLTVLFNPDEETGSAGSGALISTLGAQADIVLSFEPSGREDIDWLILGHAAYAQVRLEVTGRASHAGAWPEQGRNAVLELAHQIIRTQKAATSVSGAQLNWTNVKADQAFNQIPDRAVAVADGRITSPGAEAELLQVLRDTVEADKLIPDTEAKVSLEILRPGFQANAASWEVAELAKDIYDDVGRRSLLLLPMVKGATDAGYAAHSGKAVVIEALGPSGRNYHAANEYLLIDSIVPRLYLAARLLMELGRRSTPNGSSNDQ